MAKSVKHIKIGAVGRKSCADSVSILRVKSGALTMTSQVTDGASVRTVRERSGQLRWEGKGW